MTQARMSSASVSDGGNLTISLSGLPDGSQVQVEVCRIDTYETAWTATLPVELDATSNGTAVWRGVELGEEAALVATAILVGDGPDAVTRLPIETSGVCIGNPTAEVANEAQAAERREALMVEQTERYGRPLGDPHAPASVEHRTVSAVEGLLVRTAMRLPGLHVIPVPHRVSGNEDRDLVESMADDLGWGVQISTDWWTSHYESARPWTAVVCPSVWAADHTEAAELTRRARETFLSIAALNRGARGATLATIVQQRQPDDSVSTRVQLEQRGYRGNLLGGFASGESQRHLWTQAVGFNADPLLALCVDLYGEALREPSDDNRYFRLWSVLEVLSASRLPGNDDVLLLSGDVWPDPGHHTRKFAAPRVYEFIARDFRDGLLNEASSVAPATDLYEAVRGWYGRRNATAHYGRFDSNSPTQQRKRWFEPASRTVSDQPWGSLTNFEETVGRVLNRELTIAAQDK